MGKIVIATTDESRPMHMLKEMLPLIKRFVQDKIFVSSDDSTLRSGVLERMNEN